ncbi:hypothetical protein P175DRAFT_0529955 [Aspergillus ochraceoroseus IBT 24754]|uniref:Uncharacterized protein n=1 Tax=Aspergillus ochraceoroseus IBT 24754 TaxID=1392256 RepID=A0A2T5M2U4_9EURO|nr:uncharacterized protein P175DRAFT_0529955 [Aspergillus ochraceoroseus IBT 24754]PTU22870.1 hypothetical protein P175DRAFT_0529955 [Aspergillus ochraceoroseus IBT 24754]
MAQPDLQARSLDCALVKAMPLYKPEPSLLASCRIMMRHLPKILTHPFKAFRQPPWAFLSAIPSRIDPSLLVEEENSPYYEPAYFYPARIEQPVNTRAGISFENDLTHSPSREVQGVIYVLSLNLCVSHWGNIANDGKMLSTHNYLTNNCILRTLKRDDLVPRNFNFETALSKVNGEEKRIVYQLRQADDQMEPRRAKYSEGATAGSMALQRLSADMRLSVFHLCSVLRLFLPWAGLAGLKLLAILEGRSI